MRGKPNAPRGPAKVRDVNEFLDELGLVRPEGEIRAVATYHDACHLLHAQKIRDAPAAPARPKFPASNCATCRRPSSAAAPPARTTSRSRKCRPASAAASWTTSARPAPAWRSPPTPAAPCKSPAKPASRVTQLAVVHPMEMLDWSYRGDSAQRMSRERDIARCRGQALVDVRAILRPTLAIPLSDG